MRRVVLYTSSPLLFLYTITSSFPLRKYQSIWLKINDYSPMIECTNLTVAKEGELCLQNVSYSVQPETINFIISTDDTAHYLVAALYWRGTLKLDTLDTACTLKVNGTIMCNIRSVSTWLPNTSFINSKLTVEELIRFHVRTHHYTLDDLEKEDIIERIAVICDLANQMLKTPADLKPTEFGLLRFALALCRRQKLVIIDDIGSLMPIIYSSLALSAFNKAREAGYSIIVVSNEVRLDMLPVADTITILSKGRMIMQNREYIDYLASGNTSDIFAYAGLTPEGSSKATEEFIHKARLNKYAAVEVCQLPEDLLTRNSIEFPGPELLENENDRCDCEGCQVSHVVVSPEVLKRTMSAVTEITCIEFKIFLRHWKRILGLLLLTCVLCIFPWATKVSTLTCSALITHVNLVIASSIILGVSLWYPISLSEIRTILLFDSAELHWAGTYTSIQYIELATSSILAAIYMLLTFRAIDLARLFHILRYYVILLIGMQIGTATAAILRTLTVSRSAVVLSSIAIMLLVILVSDAQDTSFDNARIRSTLWNAASRIVADDIRPECSITTSLPFMSYMSLTVFALKIITPPLQKINRARVLNSVYKADL